MDLSVILQVNGTIHQLSIDTRTTLLDALLYAQNKVLHSRRDPTLGIMGHDPLTKFYTILAKS
jgi:hypothetical protein